MDSGAESGNCRKAPVTAYALREPKVTPNYTFTMTDQSGRAVTVTRAGTDHACEVLVEDFQQFLLACGFHRDTVRDHFENVCPPTPAAKP